VELYAAVRDNRIDDVLALVDPQIVCQPVVRPGLTVYHGHDGMVRLVHDMHAAHGRYQVRTDSITEQAEAKVTVQARIFANAGSDQAPIPVTSVFTLQDGLIITIESESG
jgi:hypothetical protein